MTTLEFFLKELNRCEINLQQQKQRKAPASDIANIEVKIQHYKKVCEMLTESNTSNDKNERK